MFKLKNKYLPLSLITIALTSSAATIYHDDSFSFDIFGRVRAFMANHDEASNIVNTNYKDMSLFTDTRLGIASRSKVTEGLDAVAMGLFDFYSYQYEKYDSTERAKYLFVGIDAYQYGNLLFGRGDGAFYSVIGVADIYNYFKTNANDYFVLGEQHDNQLMYALNTTDFDLKLSYMFRTHNTNENKISVDRAYAFAVSGKINQNFTLNYGINYVNFDYNNKAYIKDQTNYYAPMFAKDRGLSIDEATNLVSHDKVGYKYDYGASLTYGTLGDGLYSSLVYTKTDYENFEHNLYTYEFALNYSFKNGYGINLGYAALMHDKDLLISDATFGLYYDLGSALTLFVESQIDINGKAERLYGQNIAEKLNQNKFVLGAEFKF